MLDRLASVWYIVYMSVQLAAGITQDPAPLYYQFVKHLRQRVESGEWAPEARLPAEPDLAREYGLSRGTIREGLDLLAREGLIERHRGRGTFVRGARIVYEWNAFYGFVPSLRALGHKVATRLISSEVSPAGSEVGQLLGVGPDDPVVQVKRVILADDEPFLLDTDYLVEARYPGLAESGLAQHSLVEILEHRYGIRIASRERWIEPIIPSLPDQRLLGLPFAAPCLLIDQLNRTSTDQPVSFSRMIVRGDRCRHHVRLDSSPKDDATARVNTGS
ncbi:MAG: GntR family transcriptional regulator [Chloroflexi bacterium]|nr:GntR family transcriptional regulator [Chloroflexota bacterium]